MRDLTHLQQETCKLEDASEVEVRGFRGNTTGASVLICNPNVILAVELHNAVERGQVIDYLPPLVFHSVVKA